MIKDISFVYFGSPDFSTLVLDELEKGGFIPSLVITKPDEPVGRKQIITPTPVKIWAEKRNIEVLTPNKISELENFKLKIEGCDLGVLAAYGKIIPDWLLNAPKHGILNVHPSLLPKYRGPTPVQSVILSGEKETGVTIIKLDKEMDHGPILAQEKTLIDDMNKTELDDKLWRLGGKMLVSIMPDWVEGKIEAQEQEHSQATYNKKFTSEEAFIKPEVILDSANEEEVSYAMRQIRALNPEPGTWTTIDNQRIKILSAHTKEGKLVPNRIIPAGKKEMDWGLFNLNR